MTAHRRPPRNRSNPANCNQKHDGYYCSLAKLHVENHEAYDDETGDTLIHAWTQDGVEVPLDQALG